ncbi:hypothetical protein B0I35DRAFT_413945 [Stachybotrys elegans]|uniref:Uncharacterized protein n=1 Tax=Stachybotrys elegans TaxID=80388 RepID=A0A8K0WKK7_9HYPO|nr:hypothetical protein B0I35DRAFT_413945 [Stachybotrys elegans]
MSSTMEKDRIDSQEEEGSGSETQPIRRPDTKKKSRKSKKQRESQGQAGPLDKLPLDTGNALGGVTNTLGNVTGGALDQQQGGGGSGKSDTLRLRLDLNLEVEIQLKARIHGDLELALFTG